MSRTYRANDGKQKRSARRISIRAVRRTDPDLRPLGHSLAQEALAEAATEAAAAQQQPHRGAPTPSETPADEEADRA